MRKLVIIVLSCLVVGIGYFTYNAMCDNKHVKNKINILSEEVLKNEKEKELYESKVQELEEIKEINKEKSIKYDEVEAWNQEVIKYLD